MMKQKLSYALICAAVNGDPAAQNEILAYYEEYINTLSTVEELMEDGQVRRYIDEDIKAQIQMKLLEATLKWKAL